MMSQNVNKKTNQKLTAVPQLVIPLQPVACEECSDLRLNIRLLTFEWSELIYM